MAVLRRTRILIALILAVVIFFTTRHYDALPAPPNWALRPPSTAYSDETSDTNRNTPSEDDLSYTPVEPELVAEAHKLPFSDAFLPHFAAVTSMKGVTMEEAKSTCHWGEDDKVNFQYGSGQDWVNKDRSDAEIEERRQQWHDFVDRDMIPFADVKDKFNGRGIVIVAGNQDTLMRVKVILRALLKMGSSISVEINYWGDEMDDAKKEDIEKVYPHMYFNDLSLDHNVVKIKKEGIYINYQLKTAAVINSRFAEPILLDSDNIPVVDPESLYDTDVYKEYGSIFWPDIARTRPNNPAWALTNTPCRMDEFEQESGQLLVDKTKFFYHLQLAAWFNNNQSGYYNEFLLGDKDMFRFAWHALQTAYGKPKKWLTSVGTVNDGFYCGHTFGQHHPNGSVAFLHGGLVKTVDEEVIEWNRQTQGGFYRHYKQTPYNEDHGHSIDVGIKFDSGEYKPDHTEDFHGATCADMFGIEPKDLNEIVPDFEKTFEEIGGYWALDQAQKLMEDAAAEAPAAEEPIKEEKASDSSQRLSPAFA